MLVLLLSLAHAQADAPQTTAVHARMAQHLALTTAARNAVIRGNLEEANAQGKALRSLPIEALPADWQQHLSALQTAAKDLESAPNVRIAGQAMGEIGEACASCHRDTNGGPQLTITTLPKQSWTTDSHMPQHLWASEWMWIGMLSNNDEAFLRGAKTLADEPLLPAGPTRPEWFTETETEVHRIAKEMLAGKDVTERQSLYGPLLTQCGTCHMRLENEGSTPR